MRNAFADALENASTRLSPVRDSFFVDILYKPSILDNITNLSIFNDDKQILHFLVNVDVFKDVVIDEDEHKKELQDASCENKENSMLKGMVSLKSCMTCRTTSEGQSMQKPIVQRCHMNK